MAGFGPMIPPTVIEGLVLATLKTRLAPYLGNIGRLYREGDQDALPDIRSWDVQGTFEKRPEQQLPLVHVVSPGTDGDPEPDGEGFYRAAWEIETTVVVAARTPTATDQLSKLYSTAIAACLVGEPLGEPVEDVVWRGTSYDDLPGTSDRSMVAATARFNMIASRVLQRRSGLGELQADPRDAPPGDPDVATIGIVGRRLSP